jgi:NitT/TauT family transport system substrate-binding protein
MKSSGYLCILLCLTSLASCTSSRDRPLTSVNVETGATPSVRFAGLYAADQKGFFAAEGLAVVFRAVEPGEDTVQSVLQGKAQFAMASADQLILARAAGAPVVAVATIFRRSPVVFISLAEKGITRPMDFAGKTIRAPVAILPSLTAMLTRVGVSPERYTVVDVPADPVSFERGDIPVWGAFVYGFAVALRLSGHKFNMVFPDDYGVHFYGDTLFTTDTIVATNSALVSRFVRATLKGWTYAVENVAEMPLLVKKYEPSADVQLQDAQMVACLPLVNTGEDHIGWMRLDVWAGMERTLREQGVLTKKVDLTRVYTQRFLQAIYAP